MKKNVLGRMLKYLAPHKKMLVASFISALLSVPLGLLGPVFIGRAVDAVVGQGNVDFAAVAHSLAMLAITALLSAFLQWVTQVYTRKISAYAAQEMRRQAFSRINKVPLKNIDTHAHGDLVSRLVNDADAVSEGFLQGMTQLFPGIITIAATIVFMLILSPAIALVVIVVTPLSILFAHLITLRTGKLFLQQNTTQGKVSGFVNEKVNNQALLRAFGYEEASENEFSGVNQEYYEANFKATWYSSIINPGTRFVNAVVYATVGVFGAISAIGGGITVGGLSAFLAYANQYTKPFNEITSVITQLQNAMAGAERLFEVIDWPVEPPDKAQAIAPVSCAGEVTAQEVYFSYSPERPLIRDFNLQAASGQRVALVGPTGCGKTTIINLLMRFYELNSGKILVDAKDITDIKRNSLRGMYGMVLQETWLKKATVRANIAYGRPNAREEEVVAAAKAAYAHSFIKRLPQGYETVIESGGGNLSAGQKQLLCIARIMLAKPDMLILDEATSSIDTRTEMLIQQALEKLMSGHTSFIVAHRLSTIQNADMILVMKDGQIVEQGNHSALLAKQGFYARLFNSQFAVQ